MEIADKDYKHELKYCPRCDTKFECKVGLILQCQCMTVKLNDEERAYLQKEYDDCLCAKCMKEMKAEYHNNKFKAILKQYTRG